MIAVLNGVNLNLLGRRDPDPLRFADALQPRIEDLQVVTRARDDGALLPDNHEGAFVDNLHEAVGWATHGMAVNPGAWTHYSYAIRDAIEYVVQQGVEVVEVHLSDIETARSSGATR